MGESDKSVQEMERFNPFDVSTEDNCLLASSSGKTVNLKTSRFTENKEDIGGFELSDARNAQDGENAADLIRQNEQILASSECAEPERKGKFSNCNLRKSLAWDSAFFTSAGVLDAEELSFINKGLSKPESPLLPGILEDVRRSAESNSTFDSDLTLESIEIDLFEDIRASIQKSSSAVVAPSRSNTGPVERGTLSLRPSKKIGLPSQNMPKPVVASKKKSTGMQDMEKTAKKASHGPHRVQLPATSREQISSLKPPKILGRAVPPSAAPTKRNSLGARRIKVENNTSKAVSGKVELVGSKKPGLGDSGSSKLRSSSSSKSSSSGSSPSFPSVNRSGSTSSDCRGKSPANSSRNKASAKNGNLASSGSTRADPVRTSSTTKIDSGNSNLSEYLVSMSKHHSMLSPASSIDGQSSESSSSTSTVNQRSNYSKTSSSSPRSGFSIDNDVSQTLGLQAHPKNQASFRYGCNGTELLSQGDKKSSVGSSTNAHSNLSCTNVARSTQPSGLRMPSPKIGFFDAEKTAVCSPRGNLQGVTKCYPKDGAAVSYLNPSKTKPGRTQPVRTLTGTGKLKLESAQTAALCPTSNVKRISEELSEHAHASQKVPDSSKDVEDFHCKLPEFQKSPRSANHAATWEIGDAPNSADGTCVSIGKENLFRIEEQVDSLSRTVGFIDL